MKIDSYTKEFEWHPLLVKINKTVDEITKIKQRHIRLQDLVRSSSRKLRNKYITNDFYIKAWNLLKERKYEERQPK